MPDVEFYQRLYRYDGKVLAGYVAMARKLPRKELQRDRGIGIGSVQDTLVHILRVHEAWVLYIIPGDLPGLHASHDRFVARDFRGGADLERYRRDVWPRVERYIASLTAKELDRRVKAPWMPGRYTVADALMQASLEQAHHLGEVIGARWRENKASPQMMWIPTLTGQRVSVR